MYVAIRDATLWSAEYTSPAAGMDDLNVKSIELEYGRDHCVFGLTGGRSDRLNLARDADQQQLRRQLADGGYQICALLMHNRLNSDRKAEVDWTAAACRAAAALNVPALRIDTILENHLALPLARQIDVVVSVLSEVLEKTAELEVPMGMENHGTGNNPAFLFGILDRLKHRRIGMTLDTGNLYWFGLPLEEVYEHQRRLAPHTVHTHVKNINYPPEQRDQRREMGWQYGQCVCPIGEGDIDHQQVAAILRAAGYDGAFTIEDESLSKFSPERRRQILAADSAHLAACIEGVH